MLKTQSQSLEFSGKPFLSPTTQAEMRFPGIFPGTFLCWDLTSTLPSSGRRPCVLSPGLPTEWIQPWFTHSTLVLSSFMVAGDSMLSYEFKEIFGVFIQHFQAMNQENLCIIFCYLDLNLETPVCVCQLLHHLTFCDPMGCSPLGFSVHGILQARILEQVAIPFSRGSSQTRD